MIAAVYEASTLLRSAFDKVFSVASDLSLAVPTWAVHRIEVDEFIDAEFIDVAVKHSGHDESFRFLKEKCMHVKSDVAVAASVFIVRAFHCKFGCGVNK